MANEIQSITFNQTPTGGTFKFDFSSILSANVPYNETRAAIQALLEATYFGVGNVQVNSWDGTEIVIEYIGFLENTDITVQITADPANLITPAGPITITTPTPGVAGRVEIQDITFNHGPAVDGDLIINGQNAGTAGAGGITNATVKGAIDSAISPATVTVSGGTPDAGPFTVTWDAEGAVSDTLLDFTGSTIRYISTAAVQEVQEINFSDPPVRGDFYINGTPAWTGTVPSLASQAGIVESLIEATTGKAVTVTGDTSTFFEVTFDVAETISDTIISDFTGSTLTYDESTGLNISGSGGSSGVQTLGVTDQADAGTFILTDGSGNTFALAFDISDADLKTAIEGLPTTPVVDSVTGTLNTDFTITFNSANSSTLSVFSDATVHYAPVTPSISVTQQGVTEVRSAITPSATVSQQGINPVYQVERITLPATTNAGAYAITDGFGTYSSIAWNEAAGTIQTGIITNFNPATWGSSSTVSGAGPYDCTHGIDGPFTAMTESGTNTLTKPVSGVIAATDQEGGPEDPDLTTDLVAYWNMDETSGTRFDSVGSNDLTDNNSVGFDTGKIINSAEFVASSTNFLSLASNTDMQITGSKTWAGWVYMDNVSNDQAIFIKGTEWGLYFNNASTLDFDFKVSDGVITNTVSASTYGTPPADEWIFVVFWYNDVAKTMTIEIQGTTPQQTNVTATLTGAAGTVYFSGDGSAKYLDGRVDGWGVWNKILTRNERRAFFNAAVGQDYPFTAPSVSLLTGNTAYWNMDQATSATRTDAINGYDLTDNNGVTQVTGKLFFAGGYNGTNQYLSRASQAALQITGAKTFSLWAYITDFAAERPLIAKTAATTANYEYFFGFDMSAFAFCFIVSDGTNLYTAIGSDVPVVTNTWIFMTAWFDPVNKVIAIQGNNSYANTTDIYTTPNTNTNAFQFGKTHTTTYMKGRIDGSGMWDRVLNREEILALFNNGDGLDYPYGVVGGSSTGLLLMGVG